MDLASSSECDSQSNASKEPREAVLLELDMTSGTKLDGSKPWRKSAKACAEERAAARKILQCSSAVGFGVDISALHLALQMQAFVEKSVSRDVFREVDEAATALLQAATNGQAKEQVDEALRHTKHVMEAHGLSSSFQSLQEKPNLVALKLQLMHEVMPRLWLGGWQPLQENCKVLKEHAVTHIISVISAGKRQLPAFIKDHYYIQVDDNEGSADQLFQYFQPIVSFIDSARSSGNVVYVHCGAGISRGPTAVAAFVMWKLKVPARTALNLIRRVRPMIRPNVGFVSQLKLWEESLCIEQTCIQSSSQSVHTGASAGGSVGAIVQGNLDNAELIGDGRDE